MNYANIITCDVANGLGCRTSLFVSGCTHQCKNCFNKELWDFNFGNPFTKDILTFILDTLKPDYIDGLTLLGGEPLELENQGAVLDIISAVKQTYPKKTIWLYTGSTWEQLMDNITNKTQPLLVPILNQIDVLVDGPFINEEKDIRLNFRGSRNQHIIDVKESLKTNQIVLFKDAYETKK